MTRKSGPQHYPGADRTHWYQNRYPGDAMEVNVVVLHTTEGHTLPDYQGGLIAPNLTAVPDLTAPYVVLDHRFQINLSLHPLRTPSGGS